VPTTDGDLRDLLSRVPAFETLGENDLQRVAEVAVPRRFDRHEVIFREGDDSETCYIVRSGQARAVREHPDIAPKLVISLGRRLRVANERLARQSFQTVQSRVAVVLSDLVEQSRDGDGQAGDVLLRITQADIAQLAGSSRESASRFLATLERAGVLTQGRGRIVVHDPAALAGYVY